MKILILTMGKLGSTRKAGERIAGYFKGDNTIKIISNITKEINYKNYDVVIFGTNVRFGRFSKEFKKQTKIFKKSGSSAKSYAYISCYNTNKKKYEERASKKVGGQAVIVGCEFLNEKANRFENAVISSMKNYLQKNGREYPKLDTEKMQKLVNKIMCDVKMTDNGSDF